jgi:putative salt-induced outer membrane protein YdiY
MKLTQASQVTRCIVVLILSAAGVCHADQVTLDNGDRLTGKVKKLADGKVVINTDYAGDVKIDTKHVVSLETDSEMTVVLDDDTRLYGRVSGSGQTLEVSDGGATVEMAHVAALQAGHLTGKEWKFSGRFSLGASESSGNTDARNLNWDGEGVARQGKNRYTLGGRGNYASNQSAETDNNTIVYMQYDRFLSKKWYAYANASFENDRFSDIRLRTSVGGGLGYQWIETPRTNLALEAGPTYVYTDYYTQATEQNPAARLVTKFDYWLWQDVVQFFNTNEFYPSLEDYDNSFLRSQLGFRFPLVDHFIATAQLNLDWNGNPPPGKVKLDQTVILNVGYTW